MRFESIAICNALLEQHRSFCPIGNENFRHCTIGYLNLCTDAGVPDLYRSCGKFLLEIAQWCQRNGLAPLNALAINEQEEQPGGEYDLAPGCSLLTWPSEAAAVVVERRYPTVWVEQI
jgi:hypothetical protein